MYCITVHYDTQGNDTVPNLDSSILCDENYKHAIKKKKKKMHNTHQDTINVEEEHIMSGTRMILQKM